MTIVKTENGKMLTGNGGVTKLVTNKIANRGRKKNVVLGNEWYHEQFPSLKKKKMKIRNLTVREDNPWPVTLT